MFQVPSYPLIPQNQVSSSHLLDPPATDCLTSHHVSNPPETPPHMAAEFQATPPQQFNLGQAPSPHVLLPQITPPHLNGSQLTSPVCAHPYLTSSFEQQPHLIAPQFAAQPQLSSPRLLSPPQQVYNQNPDSGWTRRTELPYHQGSDNFLYQNQNHFNTGLINQQGQLGCTNRLSCNAQAPPTSTVYQQPNGLCPVQDPCRSLEATLLECSPQASVSGEGNLGRWDLMDFSSSSTEKAFSTQYYQSTAPQPFCSPTTPGPSPQYPQTPTLSSPPIQPWEESRNIYPQTFGQLSSCGLQECDSYTSQPPPHQTNHPLLSQYELIQDQTGLFDTARCSSNGLCPQVMTQEAGCSSPSPSLPAGLTWREDHGRAAEHCPPDWTHWVSECVSAAKKCPQPKKSVEDPVCRLLCTVCKRDFRSLPALNGHMRSHSGIRSACVSKNEDLSLSPSTSTVMPVSVPVHSKGRAHKKASCMFPASRRGVLYQSLLHEDASMGNGVSFRHYTPPPMLCPVRAGPGLYCSLTSRRVKRAQTIQLHNTPGDHVAVETNSPPPGTLRTRANQPQINVGRGFQAEIPLLHEKRHADADSHNALQLWSAWEEMDLPVNQQRVEALLLMARSSVVPGGGTSPESSLYILRQCRGDFLLAVEKLLSTPETNNSSSPAGRQHKQVSWSEAEKRLLVKSLQLHQKDFSRIQKAVQTKSVSECVEFYYLWKKKMSASSRGLTINR
ncbi:transcriptional-regulating factor 1-like isoform X2 [Takifugu rubripes]|uniref:Transcriptional-regulating factor 1-like n=3 Tax=Takifugu rubripes TaxID=31033 RepID=A0A674NHR0_TAKRU|nr:transcriptional-regulating factor 1-like isoform X2 [Takifugu rubripes]|eukprot:XP_011604630.1 PREDICTED: transcriptional-regulating factor 1-like isoform X2 [Takifugu rubripes]